MQTRAIPSSAERCPWAWALIAALTLRPGETVYKQLPAVLDELFRKGGTLIDSSPMYGRAEQTTGELLAIHEPRSPAFLATRCGRAGARKASRRWSNPSVCCAPNAST
jgi:aryl-alcohol dehydrogenase-like predicted oxidoreductase